MVAARHNHRCNGGVTFFMTKCVFPANDVAAYVDGRELKAAHGDRQMPIWGDVFRGPEQGTAERTVRRRVNALVEFIAALQSR